MVALAWCGINSNRCCARLRLAGGVRQLARLQRMSNKWRMDIMLPTSQQSPLTLGALRGMRAIRAQQRTLTRSAGVVYRVARVFMRRLSGRIATRRALVQRRHIVSGGQATWHACLLWWRTLSAGASSPCDFRHRARECSCWCVLAHSYGGYSTTAYRSRFFFGANGRRSKLFSNRFAFLRHANAYPNGIIARTLSCLYLRVLCRALLYP